MRTVYKNGTVYTGNGFVTDFAVENGKFCFVGETDKATADEVVDLDGKFVCAGFNDSHMHVLNLGNVLTMANLGAHTTSLKEMLDCLRRQIWKTRLLAERFELEGELKASIPTPKQRWHQYHLATLECVWNYTWPPRGLDEVETIR